MAGGVMFRVCGEGVERLNKNTGEWVFLVGSKTSRGYRKTTIEACGHKRWVQVHRVVWEAHNGPIPSGCEIDHINGVKDDNRISNLRLVSHAENMGYAAKLSNCGRPSRFKPHQIALLVNMPRNANWGFWAERWGIRKETLLNARAMYRRKAGIPSRGRRASLVIPA